MGHRLRRGVVAAASAVLVAAGLLVGPLILPGGKAIPSASAACPQVEVIFARGRLESPGVGVLGNAFVSALRSKVNKNIGVYAVRYPADNEIDVGGNDMSAHIQNMAKTCPDTRLVLGGYSLGAAVTDVVLALPFSFFGFDNPLPDGMDQKIAAVALSATARHGPGRSRTSARSTPSGPSSCATAPIRSVIPRTPIRGRRTGPTTRPGLTSTRAW